MNRAVDVWWASTSEAPPDAALTPLLDAVERTRFASYREHRAARMFVVGAALVRSVAARELAVSPRSVAVDRGCSDCGKPHGRPRLAGHGTGATVHFSVSHRGGLVGVAVAPHEVGLDVEPLGRRADLLPPAGEFLSPAELTAGASRGLGEDPEQLLLWWTRKEAVLKLLGTGLRRPPTSLSLSVHGDAVGASGADGSTLRLGLRRLRCRPGFVASLASPAPVPTVEHDAARLLHDAARERRTGGHRAASA